jgi:hypothetical protein
LHRRVQRVFRAHLVELAAVVHSPAVSPKANDLVRHVDFVE